MSMFSPPKPPDPQTGIQLGGQVAAQQQNYNTSSGEESQRGSMVDQFNPYGSLTYGQIGTGPGGVPIYGSNVNLNPEQQYLFDLMNASKGLSGQQGFNVLAGAGYGNSNPGQTIGDATSGNTAALLKKQTDYLNPFFTTQHDQLDTQLKNQGLQPGNPAYDNAMRQLTTNQGLVVSNAAAQFEPQAYSQAYQNFMLPLGLSQALSGNANPGSPNSMFTQNPALNIQPANLVGAVGAENQAVNDQYKAQMGQYSSMMNGLFGLGGAALGGMMGGPMGASLGKSLGQSIGGIGTNPVMGGGTSI